MTSKPLKIRGDKLDSSKAYLRHVLSLQRKFNVEKFMDTDNVDDEEPFSDYAPTREKQEGSFMTKSLTWQVLLTWKM